MASGTTSTRNRPPPRLTIAQVLADLTTLNIADPSAATQLITAHDPLLPPHTPTPRRDSSQPALLAIPDAPHVVRQKSASSTVGDILNTPATTPGILEGGGQLGDGEEEEEDMKRAKTLLKLGDMRKLGEKGGVEGLERCRGLVGEVERRMRDRQGGYV